MKHRTAPTVLSNKRQAQILSAVRMHGSSSITDLANELNVSDETIRRNVKILANEGLLEKVRGGVMLPSEDTEQAFPLRMNEGKEAKQRIAKQVASQIKDGDSLILDNGSTTAYIAQALTSHDNLFVVTNSVVIANILAIQPGNRVFMAGGELRNYNGGAFGPAAFNGKIIQFATIVFVFRYIKMEAPGVIVRHFVVFISLNNMFFFVRE